MQAFSLSWSTLRLPGRLRAKTLCITGKGLLTASQAMLQTHLLDDEMAATHDSRRSAVCERVILRARGMGMRGPAVHRHVARVRLAGACLLVAAEVAGLPGRASVIGHAPVP